ncbi:MAG: hypothetical protein N2558_02205 [Patescibacteria group bacterium]|nr:hypothetical protein [Patescibacteria group bacterium]
MPKWLFLLLIAVLLIRIPTFFEPYSYGDEMIYLTIGEGIRQGLTLYKDLHDNKPPLIYFTAAIAQSLFWFKAILALWNLVTIFLFWKLTEKFFNETKKARLVATSIFAILTNIPLLEGNIANAEIFMIGFTIISLLFLFKKNASFNDFFISGIFLSIAGLYKIPALLDSLAILMLFAYKSKTDQIKLINLIKNLTHFVAGLSVPIIFTLVWYSSKGVLNEYVSATIIQNFDYLSSWRPDDVQKSFFIRNYPLFVRFLILAVVFAIIFVKRREIDKNFAFATAWLLTSTFAVTLSERPYPHYLIQSVPGISIMLSYFLTNKSKFQVYALFPLFIVIAVPFYYKFWYYEPISYYKSFISFALGNYTKEEYFQTFGENINRNYKIAKYINNNSHRYNNIFVWDDSPSLYALTRRLPTIKYVAGYHINEFANKKDIIDQMQKKPPEYVVVIPNSEQFNELEIFLQERYAFALQIDEAKIWKRLY